MNKILVTIHHNSYKTNTEDEHFPVFKEKYIHAKNSLRPLFITQEPKFEKFMRSFNEKFYLGGGYMPILCIDKHIHKDQLYLSGIPRKGELISYQSGMFEVENVVYSVEETIIIVKEKRTVSEILDEIFASLFEENLNI